MKNKKRAIFVLSLILMLGYIKDHKTSTYGTSSTPTLEAMASVSKGVSFYMADVVTESIYSIGGVLAPKAKESLVITRLSDPKPMIYNPVWYEDLPILIPDFNTND